MYGQSGKWEQRSLGENIAQAREIRWRALIGHAVDPNAAKKRSIRDRLETKRISKQADDDWSLVF